jgi:nanoRNase/pAp phosphatase (c-di-AMP/oligoRNAs hydrolase)
MISRLVLGCGAVGQRLVEGATERTGSIQVVSNDEERVDTMRGENIRAERADPTDPDVLRAAGPADVVLVVEPTPERALRIAETARSVFPDATLLAYVGLEATSADRAALSMVADETIDARRNVGSNITDLVASREGVRARKLRSTLRAAEEPLAVVMHDNPDPDAIASALALVRLAEAVGVEAVPCYFGSINHQENRALVNLLDIDLCQLDPEDDLSRFGGFALVDHSRPGVNDQLPADLDVDVVVDHHPPRAPVHAEFIDLRSDVGSTSTLLTDYLRRFGIDACGGETVATALLYGIRVDTKEFSREVSVADFGAAAALLPYANVDALSRVESPDVSPETLDTLAAAIEERTVHGPVVASCIGRLRDRDALAQAADHLLGMDGTTTTFVYGYDEKTVYASARARGTTLDLGEILRQAFDALGSAGGHADMAGAQIPLRAVYRAGGLLDDADCDGDDEEALSQLDAETTEEVVREVVSGTFFETVESHPHAVPDSVESADTGGDAAGYVPSTRNLETEGK